MWNDSSIRLLTSLELPFSFTSYADNLTGSCGKCDFRCLQNKIYNFVDILFHNSNNFSPQSIEICTRLTHAWKTDGCLVSGWRNLQLRISNCFNLPFTVSCLAKIRFSIRFVGCLKQFLYLYPLSASVISLRAWYIYRSFAIFMSFHSPHGSPPDAHTISPLPIDNPISYRIPAWLNLWLNHFGLNGNGSRMGQSVPSRETNILRYLQFIVRRSHFTYNFEVTIETAFEYHYN